MRISCSDQFEGDLEWLAPYFEQAKVQIPDGTPFQQAVWKAIRDIPWGQTRTYGEIAKAIGKPKAVRAVGTACGANPLPLLIPCHRVVSKTGLGGFGFDLEVKKRLLAYEVGGTRASIPISLK